MKKEHKQLTVKLRTIRHDYLVYVLLALVTLSVYWQVAGFDFINYDDNNYVVLNPAMRAGLNSETLHWAFTTNYEANWHPLTWISLLSDVGTNRLLGRPEVGYGNGTAGVFHITNALFHVANAILLFILLNLITGLRWRSAFVAALFAIHPLHVESVAWVTERKDVLSTFLWLLTMLAYVRYLYRPCFARHFWMLLAFALGLLSKPMLVSLPLILIIVDVWPLNRIDFSAGRSAVLGDFWTLIKEKMPLLALAFASCCVTIWAQKTVGAVGTLSDYPMGSRIANAFVAFSSYLIKTVWPAHLAVIYPHPGITIPVWQVIASVIAFGLATYFAIKSVRKRPYITAGWLWYVVTLMPVIGVVQVGMQAMADRYTYVPLIGIFCAFTWGIADLIAERKEYAAWGGKVATGAAIVIIAVLSLVTYSIVGSWKDSVALFTHATQATDNNAVAEFNLGAALSKQGDTDGAIKRYQTAIRLQPEYVDANFNIGVIMHDRGRLDEAAWYYKTAMHIAPNHVEAIANLGAVYAQQHKFDEAIDMFERALLLDPYHIGARRNLETVEWARSKILNARSKRPR